MDFGIAKQRRRRARADAGRASSSARVDYAAPEQIEARGDHDRRGHLRLRRRPLRGADRARSRTSGTPTSRSCSRTSPSRRRKSPGPRPDLPEALDAVIARAMAKAPDERYATCREMIEAARAALGGAARSTPAPEPAGSRRPRRPPRRGRTCRCLRRRSIGRDDELEAVSALLGQPAVRLVTLTGLGGTGKTRLALEAATTLRDEFEEAYFVDLAPVQRRESRRLRDRRRARRPRGAEPAARRQTIAERLGDRATLIVLDNFEQVLPAAALVGELLDAVPGLKFIATSRAPLRVRGEREYAGAAARRARSRAPTLPTPPAVQLFVERAQEAKPSFELSDDNLEAVAEICRRLEGIPLAIELAAARVKLMTPEQIVGAARREAPLVPHGRRRAGHAPRRDRVELQPARRQAARRSSRASASSSAAPRSRPPRPSPASRSGSSSARCWTASPRSSTTASSARPRAPRASRGSGCSRRFASTRSSGSRRAASSRTHASRHLNRYVELAETAEPELTRAGQACLARAARRGERQHPRRARLVVRVWAGRARAAARRSARPLLEHPRPDDRGPALASRGTRGLGGRAAGRARQGVLRRRLRGARAGRLSAGEAALRAEPRARRARPATCASRRRRSSRSAGS